MLKHRLAVAALLAALPGVALAAPLPGPIRGMLAAALQTNDPVAIAAVVSAAKQTAPESAAEIDAFVLPDGDGERLAPPTGEAPIAVAAVPSGWSGEMEVGGARSAGSAQTLGLYGAFELSRTADAWTHRLSGRVDYQETNGTPTTERVALAYQPQFKLQSIFYAYGLGQYEHDRFLGYRNRFTVGAGFGISGVDRPALKISLDAGPAFRRTQFYEFDNETAIAGRGAIKIKWAPSPRVTIAQEMTFYLEEDNATARSSTALDTQLFGPLKARLSYNIHYERNSLFAHKSTDTTSRASLIYSF